MLATVRLPLYRVATADGHVRIDAAGNLQVAFVGRHVNFCFFRGRFPGHRIVFRQSLYAFANQVHRSRSPAYKSYCLPDRSW